MGSVHLSLSTNAVKKSELRQCIHNGSGAGTPPGPATCVEEDYLVRNPVAGASLIDP